MNAAERELEIRLNSLPDANPDFSQSALYLIRRYGLVSEVMQMLECTPDATVDTVTRFECEYRGVIELVDENGMRKTAEIERLRLTSGMREMLADMKGRTLKAYERVAAGDRSKWRPDDVVGIVLGQHAVHLASRDFPFDLGGAREELAALRCEHKSLRDDFGLPPSIPVHAYSVGERVTGVELATDHVGLGGFGFDVDVAVVIKTAHGAYTFARESWESTAIAVCEGDGAAALEAADARNAEWLAAHPGLGAAKVARSTAKLA